MNSYRLPLKVRDNAKNRRITAVVTRIGEQASLRVGYIPEVEADNPEFARKGRIRLTYQVKDHKVVIERLTNYLNDLFLKDLAERLKELESEDHNSKHIRPSDAGRNKGKTDPERTEERSGERSGGVHHSGGGRKSSPSGGRGKSKSALAEGRDKKDSGDSKEGDTAL